MNARGFVVLGAFTSLLAGIFLAFDPLWAAPVFFLVSAIAFYHIKEGFLGSVALFLFMFIILRMASPIFIPVSLALVIAFIFLPVVSKLEELNVPRWLSSFVITVGMFMAISVVGFIVLYNVYKQGTDLLLTLSRYYMQPYEFEYYIKQYIQNEHLISLLTEIYKQALSTVRDIDIGRFVPGVKSILTSSIELAFSTLIGLVMGFYVLKDTRVISSEIANLLPDKFRPIFEEAYNLLAHYFRGQLTVASIVGIFVGLSLQVLGIKFGVLIGFIAGISNLVPNVGFAFTVIFGSTIILLSEGNIILAFVKFGIILALDQLMETLILTPRILGKSVGLHPVIVIIALVMGASMFGALGVILAVPTAALLRSIWINKIRGKI